MSGNQNNLHIALGMLAAFVCDDQSFGYARMQRALRWGYNRACHFGDDALALGALVRVKDAYHRYQFNPAYSNLYFHADGAPWGLWSYGHSDPKAIHDAFDRALAREHFLPATQSDIEQVYARFEHRESAECDLVLHICQKSDPDAFPITWIDGNNLILKE